MVVLKIKQVKSQASLKRVVDYILDQSKTLRVSMDQEYDPEDDFPLEFINGHRQEQIVSSHLLTDEVNGYEEMMMTNRLANRYHGRADKTDYQKGTSEVYAHHIIQSFSVDDNLTPEEVNEIGRRTIMELTGGHHEFIVATHMDKDHLHNHIIFNATNSSTLNKFRWQKGTRKSLEKISDRHADLFGAKIIEDRSKIFDHRKYSAYRKQNVHKIEIKSRLDFLLKHSISLDDFLEKAKALDLFVDVTGEYVKYKLLDKDQEKNTRDRALSKKGTYSLAVIEDRVSKNEVVYSLEEVKEKYQLEQADKENDFEMRLPLQSWQVKEETQTGIYLEVDYGLRNHGIVKVPYRFVDKLDDGSFELFIKQSDFFYFTNPDQSKNNRFIKGDVLVKQLAHHNGSYILKKNPNISKLDELIREFNFLNQHQVSNSTQLDELANRFIEQLDQTDKSLDLLDDKLATLNKIRGALTDYQEGGLAEQMIAQEVLNSLSIPLDYSLEHLDKEMVEISIERTQLKETVDQISFEYRKLATLKEHHNDKPNPEENKSI
ncbi:relaxase/mobilization nuclease domain-containing protein [Streptococcus ovuberis]|uniref:Relaxase/mobilization nuclease domain-containing protein n=1 Tax=Streptococcus ovuberis TaxID=1936207 RepID=A0A7X6S030_9STRE|nr:relaxase/mobilization nuclease domain-containing protein [Streptococcus ovuberis]